MAREIIRHADGSLQEAGRWVPDDRANPDRRALEAEIAADRVTVSAAPPPPPAGEPPHKAIARAVALLAQGRPVPPGLVAKVEAMEGE